MSLKTFHIFFISVAVLLCLGFGVWCLGQPGYTATGFGSFAVGVALVAAADRTSDSAVLGLGKTRGLAEASVCLQVRAADQPFPRQASLNHGQDRAACHAYARRIT